MTINADGSSAFDDILRRVMRQPLDQTLDRVAEEFAVRDRAITEVATGVRDLGTTIGRLSTDLVDERRIASERAGSIGDVKDWVAALRQQVDALQGSMSGARAEIRGVGQALEELRHPDEAAAATRRLVLGMIAISVVQLVAIAVLAALVMTR